MKTSPTQRSLKLLRQTGAFASVVERWNPYAKIRQDLFGWVDLISVDPKTPGICGIQTTTTTNQAARLAKARGNGALIAWLLAGGRLYIHGWRKAKGRWVVTERAVTMEDLAGEGK